MRTYIEKTEENMLKKMKIGKRLIVCFIIVGVIASISGIVSVFTTINIDSKYSKALESYGFAQGDIGKAMLMITDSQRCVRDIVCFTDQEDIDAAKAKMTKNGEKYENYVENVRKSMVLPEAKEKLAIAEKAVTVYKEKREKIVTLGYTTDVEQSNQAKKKMVDELDPLYDQLYQAWADMMTIKVNGGTELSNSLTTQSIITVIVNIVLAIVSLFIAVTFGIVISKGISVPIHKVVDAAKEIANGNMDIMIDVESQDDVGELAKTFSKMTDNIKEIITDLAYCLGEMADGNFSVRSKAIDKYIGTYEQLLISLRTINTKLSNTLSEINDSTNQVASASTQMAAGASTLAEGATEQASAIQELLATVETVSCEVTTSAEDAQTQAQAMLEIGKKAQSSNQQMLNLIEAMNKISESSNGIGVIINTIEEIASQTNLLSLNAAI